MKIYASTVRGNAPIYFGEDAREQLLTLVEEAKPDKVFVITDRTVEALFTEEIREQLPYAIGMEPIVFNEGEENKNLATLQHVAGDLLGAGVTDRSLILNVGGGVTLNMGGLAASLLGRGVRFAHVATTLHAQWNVITSNRQRLNFVGRPNAIGLNRSAEFSIADPFFLESEEERPLLAGLVEFVKLALMMGGEACDRAAKVLAVGDFHKLPALAATAQACLELKLEYGGGDPEEKQTDAMEAYGRPIARALERLSEGRLLAGEALFLSLQIGAALAFLGGVMNREDYERHEALLAGLRLDLSIPAYLRTDRLLYQMHGNNKTRGGSLDLELLETPGRVHGAQADAPYAGRATVTDEAFLQAVEKVRNHAVL